jgi:hypothetical protein
MIDEDYLEQLHDQADEVRADLADRESKTRRRSEGEPMIDLVYLAALRAQADEMRRDLAARERRLEEDRQAAYEDFLAEASAKEPHVVHSPVPNNQRDDLPEIIYKEFRGRQPFFDNNDISDAEPLSLTDEQIDALAEVLAQIKMDLRAEVDGATAALSQRVASLEGKLDLLTNLITSLIGNNNNSNSKAFEASEVVRKVRLP